MNSHERLKEYISSDAAYQEYLGGKMQPSDFEKFCIQHCKDIEEMLNENTELRIQMSAREEVANKYKEVIDKTIEYIEKDMWNTLDDGNISCYVIERAEEELLSILKEVK